ncbi:hypothetical protein FRB94_010653 [Tulasnella sp. JGI-2019a]|nr:hypothetical protein FRB94_010653 [Tulasnella sp. JGI-2019a]
MRVYVIQPPNRLSSPPLRLSNDDACLVSLPEGARPLGGGGNCDMYRGEFRPTGLILALKRPRLYIHDPEEAAAISRRFRREANVWSELNHRNVLQFYGMLDIHDDTYLVSPWMKHGDLAKFDLSRRRYLALPEHQRDQSDNRKIYDKFDEFKTVSEHRAPLAATLIAVVQVQGIVSGIQYLHSRDIIHGDIKAANILLDQDLVPSLCDFGLSKILDGYNVTSTGMKGVGTVPWMSPELLENKPKTTQSDIYALGMTIGEMLSGITPFVGRSQGALIRAIMLQDPPFAATPAFGSKSLYYLWNIGFLCRLKDPARRPTARQINFVVSLDLPFGSDILVIGQRLSDTELKLMCDEFYIPFTKSPQGSNLQGTEQKQGRLQDPALSLLAQLVQLTIPSRIKQTANPTPSGIPSEGSDPPNLDPVASALSSVLAPRTSRLPSERKRRSLRAEDQVEYERKITARRTQAADTSPLQLLPTSGPGSG